MPGLCSTALLAGALRGQKGDWLLVIAGTENTATRCALHTALLVTRRPVMEVYCTDSGLQLRIREGQDEAGS